MIWIVSIKQAFTALNRNRKLIGIALVSVIFGKIINLIEQFTNKTLYALAGESVNMDAFQQALESARTGHFEEFFRVLIGLKYLNFEQPQSLIIIGSLVIGSFLIAFYSDTGLASLIRDLLIQNNYRSAQVIAYGQMYFIPAFIFKGSFYLFTGLVVIAISPLLFFLSRMLTSATHTWTAIGICVLPLLIIYTGFLSLGMKFIIVEGENRISIVYRLTKAFMLENKWEVTVGFLFMVVVTAISTITAYYLLGSQLQFLISYSLSIFLLSYVTTLLKITGFVFYLLVRDR